MRESMLTAVIIALFLLVMAMPALAEETQTLTRGQYTSQNAGIEQWLNETDFVEHTHNIDKQSKFSKAIGLDLTMYENPILKLGTETRYNLDTYETTVASVVEVNVFQLIKNIKK